MDVEGDSSAAATNGNVLQFGTSVPISSLIVGGRQQASLHNAMALQKQRRLEILGQSGPISLLWDMEDRLEERSFYLGLPAHLLLRVFAFLPVLSIFHLRLVCKAWNSLLRSPLLLRSWVPSYPNQEAWLVVGSIALTPTPLFAFQFLAYCPSLQHWFHLPIDSATSPRIDAMLGSSSCFLGPKFLTYHSYHAHVCVDNAIVADSDGGLICFVIDDRPLAHRGFSIPRRSGAHSRSVHSEATPHSSGHVSIVVLNPLTGAVKQLPPPPDLDVAFGAYKAFSISMCSQGGAHADYHVILSEAGKAFINSFHIYSSSTNAWKVSQGESSYKELCGRVDDVLGADFFRTMSSRALKGYNIKRDQWSVIEVTSPEVQRFDIRGFKWKGDLYSAKKWSIRPWEEETLVIGFSVFRLESASDTVGRWVEIGRTPSHCVLSTTLLEERFCRLRMVASQNLVCMQAMHTLKKDEFLPPLVYNLFTNRWCRLPPYNGSYSFEKLFVFTPRLDAAV